MDLNGRVAIVTGGGRGIGKTIALKLAGLGATVVINDIGNMEPAEGVAAEIKVMGRDSLVIPGDVSSTLDANNLIEGTVTAFGKVDILVNNAGIARDKLLLRMTDEEWDKVLAVDLRSVFLCTRAAIKHMTRQRWGRIVSMASIVGIAGNAGQSNYSAAKAGIIGFTKSVAKEVGSRNITVNAVAPGFIETQMTQALSAGQREEMLKRVPLGRAGTPEDVAAAVAFLASEDAGYITGHVLCVDGGMGGL